MGHKKALIVGINYVGTENELRGCVNDAHNVQEMLTSHFGFKDIQMLLDSEATTQNILNGMKWLVAGCKPGDTLYFHFSGHGSQIYDAHHDEVDGVEEILCPVDLDWKKKVITDDQMKTIFNDVPAGVNLTLFFDCCHSGDALDQANHYQPYGKGAKRELNNSGRFIPPPQEMQLLIEHQPALTRHKVVNSRDVNATGLLIAGCQSHQTSADAHIGNTFQGAATYSLIQSLKKSKYKISYKHLIENMNQFMIQNGYSQRPELDGSTMLFNVEFLTVPGA